MSTIMVDDTFVYKPCAVPHYYRLSMDPKKKFHGMFVSVQKWRMISKSHGHVTTTLGM